MKKRHLRKPFRWALQTAVFTPTAMLTDLILICLALVEPERVLMILVGGLCLTVNAALAHKIYSRRKPAK